MTMRMLAAVVLSLAKMPTLAQTRSTLNQVRDATCCSVALHLLDAVKPVQRHLEKPLGRMVRKGNLQWFDIVRGRCLL